MFKLSSFAYFMFSLLAILSTGWLNAAQPFVDEFEDANVTDDMPVTWVRSTAPFDKGNIEVLAGNVVLTAPNSGPIPIPNVSNYWEMGIVSHDKLYHDVDIRTQVRAPRTGTSAVVVGALDTYYVSGDSGTGVYFGFVVDGGAPWALINSEIDGVKQEIAGVQGLTFSHQETDLNLRLKIEGLNVSAWAWPIESEEPTAPLMSAMLPNVFANVEGRVELGAGSRSTAVPVSFRYVSVVPEPNGIVLGAIGGVVLLLGRRRQIL